jgi:Zn-dependent peptidase ImmA (M78 family)
VDGEFTITLRDQTSSEATDRLEIEANTFAAELLMPRDFVA